MNKPLADNFTFWQPPAGHSVEVGADSTPFELPAIPLPILTSDLTDSAPSDNSIGTGLYDYLRQFPACPHNSDYAALLRDAWPHYISDLASMIVMLDHKEVDAPYLRRKLTGLQILLLLDPENPGLLLQLGIVCYDLALNYVELVNCQQLLTRAISYFAAAQQQLPSDPGLLNYMAQIDYLLGDYPKAIERWQRVAELVDDAATRDLLAERIAVLQEHGYPEQPLLVDLEAIGEAMQLLAAGDADAARTILERLEQQDVVPTEFPNPEFFSLLAISRERTDDTAGAQAAFARALEIDPQHPASLEGMERLLKRGA